MFVRRAPDGEPHDDWLRLDQGRVNNPVIRLSNNQIVGFLEITHDGNPELADQTSREGILQSRGFDDLRRLMYFVLQILEAQRQALRHPRAPQREVGEPTEAEKRAITAELHRLARSAPPEVAADLRRIAGRLKDAGAREKAQQRLFVEDYSELAAVGQAAIGLSRAVQPI